MAEAEQQGLQPWLTKAASSSGPELGFAEGRATPSSPLWPVLLDQPARAALH